MMANAANQFLGSIFGGQSFFIFSNYVLLCSFLFEVSHQVQELKKKLDMPTDLLHIIFNSVASMDCMLYS